MRPTLAWDSETHPIRRGLKDPKPVCFSVCAPGLGSTVFSCAHGFGGRSTEDFWRDVLQSQCLFVGHNVAFDFAVLGKQFPSLYPLIFAAYDDDRVTDTMLRYRLIDIAYGNLRDEKREPAYNLAATHAHFVGGEKLEKGADTWRLRYGELDGVPVELYPSEAFEYARRDASAPYEVYEKQDQWSWALGDEFRQARHAFWLQLVGNHGFRIDLERLAGIEESIYELIDGRDGYRAQLLTAGLLRKERKKGAVAWVKNEKAVRERVAQAMGDRAPMTEPSARFPMGQVSAGVEACAESGDPLLEMYADYRHLTGVLDKDVKTLSCGRVFPSFQSLLETGRTSARGNADGDGYNTQNPARGTKLDEARGTSGVRECFVPDEGECLVDADYSGLELATTAVACLRLVGRSSMAPLILAKKDLHVDLASDLVGISYDDAKKLYVEYERSLATHTQPSEWATRIGNARQDAKPGNFGFPGGMGAATYVGYCAKQRRKITLERAQEVRAAWQRKRPEFPGAYFPYHSRMTRGGHRATIQQLGTRRFRGGCSFTEACNTEFQGLGADATKDAGFELVRACFDFTRGSVLYGSRVVNYVHDQFLVSTRPESVHEVAQETRRIMVDEANKWLYEVPVDTEPCAADCWSKKARAVHDAQGRLIVWRA